MNTQSRTPALLMTIVMLLIACLLAASGLEISRDENPRLFFPDGGGQLQ